MPKSRSSGWLHRPLTVWVGGRPGHARVADGVALDELPQVMFEMGNVVEDQI